MNVATPPKEHQGFDFRDLPDELIYVGVGIAAAGLFVGHLVLTRHPLLGAAGAAALGALGYLLVWVRARLLDRRAARLDPPSPGVIVGTVQGDWKLARPRPFRVPWQAFHQHVLVAGPTGRGKTFTFIEPMLRGLCARRRRTGVFCLDGKGDRVDQDPAINFDFVFCPEDPAASSYWNPHRPAAELEGDEVRRRRIVGGPTARDHAIAIVSPLGRSAGSRPRRAPHAPQLLLGGVAQRPHREGR